MATRTAVKLTPPLVNQPKGLRVGLVAVHGIFSYGAGMSGSAGDVIQMVRVPAGASVVYVALSGGSGDALFSLGDGVSETRYLAYSSMGSVTGGVRTISLHAANVPYVYSTDDTIDVFTSTVSVGTITGGFHLTAIFSMDEN